MFRLEYVVALPADRTFDLRVDRETLFLLPYPTAQLHPEACVPVHMYSDRTPQLIF